jgi:hypothetical protein
MSKLAHELKRPNAGPQWAPAGEPGAIQAKFGGEMFALVVGIRLDAKSRAPQIPNSEGDVPLQIIPQGDGWVLLASPSPAAGASHLLVMGWMRVRPVRGGILVPYAATREFRGLLPLPLDVGSLQEALVQWHAEQPKELERCLLALPTPSSAPGPNREGARSNPSASSTSASSDRQDTHFAFASCQYPAGLFDRPPAGASFDRLEQALAAPSIQPPIAALLLLGDQIYADATYGILDPARREDRYGEAYRAYDNALRRRTEVSQLANSGRVYVTPDDHEFSDNWEPGPGAASQTALKDGFAAFEAQRVGPLPLRQASGGYWGAVDVGGGHEVFMLDARTQRDPRPWGPRKTCAGSHILNAPQRTALQAWLLGRQLGDLTDGPVAPKFISSSVWLLPRLAGRAGTPDEAWALSDAWDGYPASLHWLLSFIAKNNIRGVVVLCGDGHLAGHAVVQLACDDTQVNLHVLHAPALYAPFPFANARPNEYATQERLSWAWANDWVECEVNASLWPLGDGFVQIGVHSTKGLWEISVTFDTSDLPHRVCWTVG